jgi:hypothetical protein
VREAGKNKREAGNTSRKEKKNEEKIEGKGRIKRRKGGEETSEICST